MEQKIIDRRQRAEILGPNIWILFWLLIPHIISTMMKKVPGLEWGGGIIDLVCGAVYILLLWKMIPANDNFQRAVMIQLGTLAFSILSLIVFGNSVFLNTLALVVIAVCDFLGVQAESKAYSQVLFDVELRYSNIWETFWKVYGVTQILGVATIISAFVSVLLQNGDGTSAGAMAMSSSVAVLLLLAGFFGIAFALLMIVVGIWRLILLYKTANVFRDMLQTPGL